LRETKRVASARCDPAWTPAEIDSYRPAVQSGTGEWTLSEIDIEWISTGAFIMGCGGGGSPVHAFLGIRELIRQGKRIVVKDLAQLRDEALIGWGGGMGSPEVASERLIGNE
jgi:DUF917 family protein